MGERVERERHDRIGALALEAPPEPVRRQPSAMIVGAVDDHAEHDADRVADEVLSRLANHEAGAAPEPASRIRRAEAPAHDDRGPIGAAGGALDTDTAGRIQRAQGGGSALGGEVRRRMEAGFGADLGHVRVHHGAEASALNEAMSAQAFTVGNDVFVHDSTPDAATPAGERVLAHEIAHTRQQGDVHRLWSLEQFKKNTYEGRLTGKSTAQKQIEQHLALYREAAGTVPITDESNQRMVDLVLEMKEMASSWIASHSVKTSDGGDQDDPSRKVRMAGMRGFVTQCDAELAVLARAKGELSKQSIDPSTLTVSQPSEGAKKVTDHYAGDTTSAFRHLGLLIDTAAPLDGDGAAINLSVKVPVYPPAYVGFEFAAEVERDDGHVSVSLNLGITGGANVGGADIGGALGGYIKATAKTGADAAELMSYALFRRCRSSNMVPREVENLLWGGDSGVYGWQKAEQWSLGVEQRIFAGDEDAEVESGVYGSVSAKGKLGGALELGGSVKGTLGTKINAETLQARKGGAGAKNLRSGADQNALNKNYAKDNVRGAQKNVGVGTGGLEMEITGTVGSFEGSVGCELGWSSDGAHGKKTISLTTFELSPSLSFEIPSNAVIGQMKGTILPGLVNLVNRAIRGSVAGAEQEGGGKMGKVAAGEVASWANHVAGLATLDTEAFAPFVSDPSEVGTSFEGSTKYTLSGSFDFVKGEMSFSLNQTDGGALTKTIDSLGEAFDMVEFGVEKTSRLFKVVFDGSGWSVK